MNKQLVKLTDICEFQGGSQPPKDQWLNKPEDGYVRMLQIRDFTQSRVEKEYVKITNSIKRCLEDDILIARYGASVGKILTGLEGAYNVAIMKTIPNENMISKKYLYYFLITEYFQRKIQNLGSRAAQAGFNKTELEEIQLYVPSINIQRKISDILDQAQSLINKRKAQIEDLDKFIQSVFLEMFGDPVRNIHKWEEIFFEEIMIGTPQNGLYKPSSAYVLEGGNPILRIDSFYDGKLENIIGLKRLKCDEKCLETYRLDNGDIVINRVNSIEYLGKCALIEGLIEETVFESNMMRIKVNEQKVNPQFITKLLCSKYINNQILASAKKSVNQASINQKDISAFKVIVPPLYLQNKFAQIAQKTEKQKALLRQSLTQLEDNFDSLMQQAFKGELFN